MDMAAVHSPPTSTAISATRVKPLHLMFRATERYLAAGINREGELQVSDELPQRLSTIMSEIEQTIAECESEMSERAVRLQRLLDSVERQRSDIHADLEERQLERMIREGSHESADAGGEDHEQELRELEGHLLNSYSRAASLQRQVIDFAHLLAASRQNLTASSELLDVDDAQQLTLRQAMIRAKEDERRRLSREVHDGPAQVLANAIIGLEFIERALVQGQSKHVSGAVEEIRRIKGSMREGLSEIRRFIFDLRPSMLSQRGLVKTLEHYVQTYRNLLPDDVALDLPPQPPGLSPDQELTAFRVIQESLQNIHRHAGSTRCEVEIDVQPTCTIITVRDNGRGFDPDKVNPTSRGGSGIVGMRERAEVIGARLNIISSPGNGTEISLEIPAVSQSTRSTVRGGADRFGTS
jgi:two-component system, NarL family, sensor histidine kinase DegS